MRLRCLSLTFAAVTLCGAATAVAQSATDAPEPRAFAPLVGRAVCAAGAGYGAQSDRARTFLWRPEALAIARLRALNDPAALAGLLRRADAALSRALYSVTEKRAAPPGGSANDYASIGPYWWPAPGKRGGLPYVRRDGKVNPESRDVTFDKARMVDFSRDVVDLALAWHLTADRRYADHAARMLKAWFLDPATRMNPHMNFAQAVPGVSTGRAEGLIEVRVLTPVAEAVGLLGPSGALTADDEAGIEHWYAQMAGWMTTSPIAQAERAKTNNHGLFYDATLMHFALFARLTPVAEHVARAWPTKRLAIQLAADGSLPEELPRTRSLHYSFFALEAATQAATLAECVGIDLWNAETSDGRGLASALTYLEPYAKDPTTWPHPEQALTATDPRAALVEQMARPLRMAGWGTGDGRYETLAEVADGTDETAEAWWLPRLPAGGAK